MPNGNGNGSGPENGNGGGGSSGGGGGYTPPIPPTPVADHLEINKSYLYFHDVGQIKTVEAAVYDQDGNVIPDAQIEWVYQTDDPPKFSIDFQPNTTYGHICSIIAHKEAEDAAERNSSGKYLSVPIFAIYHDVAGEQQMADNLTCEFQVQKPDPPPTLSEEITITLTPASNVSLKKGEVTQVNALIQHSNRNERIEPEYLRWHSSDTNIAIVSGEDSTQGTIRGLKEGEVKVWLETSYYLDGGLNRKGGETLISKDLTVTVEPERKSPPPPGENGDIHTIQILDSLGNMFPTPYFDYIGGTTRLRARVVDGDGNELTQYIPEWSGPTDSNSIVSIEPLDGGWVRIIAGQNVTNAQITATVTASKTIGGLVESESTQVFVAREPEVDPDPVCRYPWPNTDPPDYYPRNGQCYVPDDPTSGITLTWDENTGGVLSPGYNNQQGQTGIIYAELTSDGDSGTDDNNLGGGGDGGGDDSGQRASEQLSWTVTTGQDIIESLIPAQDTLSARVIPKSRDVFDDLGGTPENPIRFTIKAADSGDFYGTKTISGRVTVEKGTTPPPDDPDDPNYDPLAPVVRISTVPGGPDFVTTTQNFVVRLRVGAPFKQQKLKTILNEVIKNNFHEWWNTYYDQLRYGKTLLNFSGNEQHQITAWKRGDDNKVIVRLANALPLERVGSNIMVSREVQNSVFESMRFFPVDAVSLIPQLRPAVPSLQFAQSNKIRGTLEELIVGIAGGSGSLGDATSNNYRNFVSNQVLERQYNVAQKSMDINADYSNFEHFVTFGSAQKRLDVFKAKLEKIEQLIKVSPIVVDDLNLSGSFGSAADTGSFQTVFGTLSINASGSASLTPQAGVTSSTYDYLTSTKAATTASASGSLTDFVLTSALRSKELQELIRGFDGYEKELWFDTGREYSASDATNHNIDNKYKADYTYPKVLGVPLASTFASSSNWYSEMSSIATDYDADNKNRLTENIPNYLFEDEGSVDFVTFTDLIGHHFDNVKLYIKNLENLSSRYPKVNKEISAPMASAVIESFGVSIPSISGVESLVRYVTGHNTGSVTYKEIADEYYKRYLHALPFLLKSKGTKQSVASLLNVFGVNPNLLTIRESLLGKYTTIEPVKVTTKEQDFSLNFNSGSYLTVPLSSSLREPKTIQMRFSLSDVRTQTVMNFEPSASYRLNAVVHPSSSQTYYANYGRLDLISGSVQGSHPDSGSMISSDYFDLFDENHVSVQLKYNASGVKLNIRKIENEETTFSASLQESAPSMSADWGSLSEAYIGHPAPSASVGYISASLDEFRLWGEDINDGKFIEFAENPGMYAGNTYSSSLQDLFVKLSFNLPTDVSSSGYVVNTTPYVSKSIGVDLTNISSSRFNSGVTPLYQTQRSIRTTIENSYKAGGNVSTTDMIRVAPAPPLSGSLSRNPQVSLHKKFATSSMGSTGVDMSVSPIDAVDRDIIRSFGNINLGDYIGRPIDRNSDRYTLLNVLERTFVRDLAPTIDYNAFIRFFDKFLHMFSEVVEEYIPARTNLTEGIVIRSSIVDRSKIRNSVTQIKMGGEVTRRTNNAITSTDKDVIRSFDPVISVTPSIPTTAQLDFSSIDTTLSGSNYTAAAKTGSKTPIISVVHGYDQSGFDSLYGTITRNKKEQGVVQLFAGNGTASLATNTTASVSPVQNGALSFRPSDDFTSFNKEAYTYFAQKDGFAYIDQIRHVPVTQSWMMPQPNVVGNWSSGTSYVLGDVVTQPTGTKDDRVGASTSGSELSENGNQFVFKNRGSPQNTKVKSIHAPQLDAQNWTLLKYRGETYQKLVRLVYVGGNVENVSLLKDPFPTTHPWDSVPKEYGTGTRKHFRFFRDNSLGARRRSYEGTLNTEATSADFGPPFEVFDINVNTIQVGSPDACD